MSDLTIEHLKSLLRYDPESGVFTWIKSMRGPVRAGDVAGRPKANGYLSIKIQQVDYYAHRLAFLYMTGEWPAEQVDHIDRDRANNRWSNLRQASPSQNLGNSVGRPSRNQSGLKGVSLHKKTGLYRARISTKTLSYHKTKEEAHAAYAAAAVARFGEFAKA